MSPLALSLRFLQKQPDSRLAELAAAGHERAFEALVQRYRRALLGYCRRYFPSDAGAEDVLQQALLQAWVALRNSDAEVKDVRPWLYRIVHNVALTNLRRPRDEAFTEETMGGAADPEEEFERRLAAREALVNLASLPEQQRQVMFSTALEGRSHEEVAAGMGLSQGAVRGLIYRARATLRSAAAALVPTPLMNWLLRDGSGRTSAGGRLETLAGGGSAGVTGLLLKGGTLAVTAGAIVTAAGITSHQAAPSGNGHRLGSGANAPALTADKNRAGSAWAPASTSPAARSQGAGTNAGPSTAGIATSANSSPSSLGAAGQTSVAGSARALTSGGGFGRDGTHSGSAGSAPGSSGGSGGDHHRGGGDGGSQSSGSSGSSSSGGHDGGGGTDGGSSSGSRSSGSTSSGGGGRDGGGGSDGGTLTTTLANTSDGGGGHR